MGYFSNGTEGECYTAQYCSKCAHMRGPDGDGMCAVWMAHMVKNYDECNNPESILHMLIPRKGIENLQCLMFMPKSALDDLSEADRKYIQWMKERAA